MRVLISVLIMLVFSGCTDSPPAIHDWKISGARTVRYLLTEADTTVLLILDPTQCFTCSGELAEWLDGERRGRFRLQLVLNRQLREEEAGQFVIYRVKPAGFLDGVAHRMETPRIYRFTGTTVLDSAVGLEMQRALITRIAYESK